MQLERKRKLFATTTTYDEPEKAAAEPMAATKVAAVNFMLFGKIDEIPRRGEYEQLQQRSL